MYLFQSFGRINKYLHIYRLCSFVEWFSLRKTVASVGNLSPFAESLFFLPSLASSLNPPALDENNLDIRFKTTKLFLDKIIIHGTGIFTCINGLFFKGFYITSTFWVGSSPLQTAFCRKVQFRGVGPAHLVESFFWGYTFVLMDAMGR